MHTSHKTPTAATPVMPKPATPTRSVPGKPGARPDDEGNGLKVLTYLRLHWLMILFCGTLLGSGGAYAAWELLASKYESYGLFQVQSVPPTVANLNNPNQARTDFVTYLKTTSALIKSEFVLNAALRDIKDLPTIKAQKDPIKFLDEELLVSWQDGSEVIRVTFKSHEPADAKKIVDAVQAAFMKEVIQKDVQDKRRLIEKVEEAMIDMRKQLEKFATAKAGGVRSPSGVTPVNGTEAAPPKDNGNGIPTPMPMPPNPLPALTPEGAVAPAAPGNGNPNAPALQPVFDPSKMDPRTLIAKIASLQTELERLPLAINDGKRRLTLLQQKLDEIQKAPVPQATLDAIDKDQEVIVQSLTTKQAQRQYEFYAQSGDPRSPGVQRLKEAWDAHKDKLEELRKVKANALEGTRRVAEGQKIAAE
ncbi:MAG: hypothetical protein U0792_24370, partial [Gemmataceae bacterium]